MHDACVRHACVTALHVCGVHVACMLRVCMSAACLLQTVTGTAAEFEAFRVGYTDTDMLADWLATEHGLPC